MASKFEDPDLVFNSELHEYWYTYWYGGFKCISVTQLIKSYCKPFDAESNAKRMAARDGVSTQSLLDKWRLKSESASAQGTYVHTEAERMANELAQFGKMTMYSPGTDASSPKIKALYKWYADHIEMGYGYLESEVRVVNPNYLIAGTVDLVSEAYNGTNAIIDFKTNEEITLAGYNNMLPPFQRGKLKLSDCSYCIYALQLNLYRRILAECYDWHAENLVLVHLESSGNYVEYNVRHMDDHIDAMLRDYDPEEWEVQQALAEE